MLYRILVLYFLSSTLLNSIVIKIDKLVVKSIRIDSGQGLSFKNMYVIFEKGKKGKDIIMNAFDSSQYEFNDCNSSKDNLDCLNIRDLKFDLKGK